MATCPRSVLMYDMEALRRFVMPCRGRTCPYCGARYWRKRVLAGLHAGLQGGEDEYLALLLTAPGDVDAAEFNASAAKRWHRFFKELRRSVPGLAGLQFWKVAELQERGHVHFHAVLRGASFIDVEAIRRIAVASGFGPEVGIRHPRDYRAGVRGLGWYFGKYLLKRYDRDDVGVTKLVTFSNGWREGWKAREAAHPGRFMFAGNEARGWREFGLTVDGSVVRDVRPRWAPERLADGRYSSWQAARRHEIRGYATLLQPASLSGPVPGEADGADPGSY